MFKMEGVNAPEKTCEDPKCPWHGDLSVRGKVIDGEVVSAKMNKSAVIKWEFIRKIKKYERFSRKTAKVAAHVPPCITLQAGDSVLIAECRRISKTKQFVVIAKRRT